MEKNLQQWLQCAMESHPQEIELGLDRVRAVALKAKVLDHQARAVRVIVVAGTNGKGSCVASLEHLLRLSGRRTASLTSPHVERYNERIKVNTQPVDDDTLCRAFAAIDEARGDISLTYFEYNVLVALEVFKAQRAQDIVLEVGLGGRLDAVNIVEPDLCVITSIDIDHQEWLGDTREAISLEKAGILRREVSVVVGDDDPPIPLLNRITELHCSAMFIGCDYFYRCHNDTVEIFLHGESRPLCLQVPTLPLASVATALQCFARLEPASPLLAKLFESNEKSDLKQDIHRRLSLPGRMQQINCDGIAVLLDVAHNPASVKHLVQSLRTRFSAECKFHLVLGIMADKDIPAICTVLEQVVEHWHCADLAEQARAASAELLEQHLKKIGVSRDNVSAYTSVGEALHAAIQKASADVSASTDTNTSQCVLVCGSFFTVEAALAQLRISGFVENDSTLGASDG